MKGRATEPLPSSLPALLKEQGVSLREVARRIGVQQSHLTRVIHGTGGRTATGELAEKIATALGVPPDYFPEARRWRLIQRLDQDPPLRDRLYDREVRSRG